jgi:hypothetical protein
MAKNIALTMDEALVGQLMMVADPMIAASRTVLCDMADILLDSTVVSDNFFGKVDGLVEDQWLPLG